VLLISPYFQNQLGLGFTFEESFLIPWGNIFVAGIFWGHHMPVVTVPHDWAKSHRENA